MEKVSPSWLLHSLACPSVLSSPPLPAPFPSLSLCPAPVLEWQKTFEEKLTPLLSVRESLSEEEAQKMGRKDPEQEVEKFVTSNTQELGKDKWLCPLSGKKFKVWDVLELACWGWGGQRQKAYCRPGVCRPPWGGFPVTGRVPTCPFHSGP